MTELSADPADHHTEDYVQNVADRRGMEMDPEAAVERCNEIIDDLEDAGHDTDWISLSTCFEAITMGEDGVPMREESARSRGELVLPDKETYALWKSEIKGQLSDGEWENHWNPVDGWQDYVYRDVIVDPSAHLDFDPEPDQKVDFDRFINRDWSDAALGRMIFTVRAAGIDAQYDEEDLREDYGQFGERGRFPPEQQERGVF